MGAAALSSPILLLSMPATLLVKGTADMTRRRKCTMVAGGTEPSLQARRRCACRSASRARLPSASTLAACRRRPLSASSRVRSARAADTAERSSRSRASSVLASPDALSFFALISAMCVSNSATQRASMERTTAMYRALPSARMRSTSAAPRSRSLSQASAHRAFSLSRACASASAMASAMPGMLTRSPPGVEVRVTGAAFSSATCCASRSTSPAVAASAAESAASLALMAPSTPSTSAIMALRCARAASASPAFDRRASSSAALRRSRPSISSVREASRPSTRPMVDLSLRALREAKECRLASCTSWHSRRARICSAFAVARQCCSVGRSSSLRRAVETVTASISSCAPRRAAAAASASSLSTFNSSAFPRSFSASALSSPASAARYTSTRSASCARLASSALTSLLTLLTLSSSIFILLMACCSASSLSRAADTRGMSTSRRATNFVSVSLSSRWCDSSKSDPEAAAALALLAVPRAELRSPG